MISGRELPSIEKSLVPMAANHPVNFKITSGENAELVGENPINAERGSAGILLRTKDFKGPVSIEATANELSSGTISIK